MSWGEGLDWFLRAAVVLGIPGVVMYLVKERRKNNAEARTAEAEAQVDEAEVPFRVKTSSIVTLEAEVAALQRAFDMERSSNERTIEHLAEQLEAERAASAAKDARIRELEAKVQELQTRVADVSEELRRVSEDLASLHDGPGGA